MTVLTLERVQESIHYNPTTGVCTWLRGRNKGKTVGWLTKSGYIETKIDQVSVKLHRLIWLLVTGKYPTGEIDHKDHNKSNNVWSNLRDVTRLVNMQNKHKYVNNTTGCAGVTFNKACKSKPWCARIGVKGKRIYLGSFATQVDAVAAKVAAELKYGFHRNHNSTR